MLSTAVRVSVSNKGLMYSCYLYVHTQRMMDFMHTWKIKITRSLPCMWKRWWTRHVVCRTLHSVVDQEAQPLQQHQHTHIQPHAFPHIFTSRDICRHLWFCGSWLIAWFLFQTPSIDTMESDEADTYLLLQLRRLVWFGVWLRLYEVDVRWSVIITP